MSGLAGIVRFDGYGIETHDMDLMTQSVAYRGPDGIHVWCDKNVGLAYLALNITPESVNEKQPLISNYITLIADVRIDNRNDLIKRLNITHEDITDADLILSAYQKWGLDCAEQLIGDYVFAIWDALEQRLLLARDPMGMRTLYYYQDANKFVFATEIKQILALPDVSEEIHEQALGVFFTGPNLPPDWTFYKDIWLLPAGHILTLQDKLQRRWKFWDINPEYTIQYKDEREYAEHFRELFKASVITRLRSIKPLGLSLSGGMDSMSIASMVGWLAENNVETNYPAPLLTFSHAYEQLKECDERHISRLVTHHFNFPEIDLPAEEMHPLADYPLHGPDSDDPFISVYQPIIEFGLKEAQNRHVGAMMSGGRGDLLTSGWFYDYWGKIHAGRWKALLQDIQTVREHEKKSIASIITKQIIWPPYRLSKTREQIRKMLRRPPAISEEREIYPNWVNDEFAEKIQIESIVLQNESPPSPFKNPIKNWRYQVIFNQLQMRVAIWSERNHAKFQMGYIDSYSDRRLTEFILAIPHDQVNKTHTYKYIAHQAMQDIMPTSAHSQVQKILPTPAYMYALRNQAQDTVFDLIDNSIAHKLGYVEKSVVRSHYESIINGEVDHPNFWWILVIEMWLNQFWR